MLRRPQGGSLFFVCHHSFPSLYMHTHEACVAAVKVTLDSAIEIIEQTANSVVAEHAKRLQKSMATFKPMSKGAVGNKSWDDKIPPEAASFIDIKSTLPSTLYKFDGKKFTTMLESLDKDT